MTTNAQAETPIPLEEAIRVCEQISPAKLKHWWDPSAVQCRGCIRFSKDIEHRCFAAAVGNRGCGFVNAHWNREHAAAGVR